MNDQDQIIYSLIISKNKSFNKKQKLIRHYDLIKYKNVVDELLEKDNLSLLRIFNLMRNENLISCSYSTFYRTFNKSKISNTDIKNNNSFKKIDKKTSFNEKSSQKVQFTNMNTNKEEDNIFSIPKLTKKDEI